LRSPERLALLARKEWHELLAARAWWLYLAAVGVLVGHAFATAVSSYAEVSGAGGGPAALAQGVSPLDGFVVPVFGAYAIAATLLLPFVAIRLMAADKESGALSLVLQSGARPVELVAAKFLVALAGWLVGLAPGLAALGAWAALGGHLNGGEVAVVLAGHLARATWTIALALAAAALTESASTAAIVALGVTLATWALDFVAAVRGGTAQRLAAITPEAALRVFERGELSAPVAIASLVASGALLAIAAQALPQARGARGIAARVGVVLAGAALLLAGAGRLRGSADLSEDRRNSFAPADERALASIDAPLRVEVRLAPEDPRLADLEQGVLRKLRRTMRDVDVRYRSGGGSGLFDADPHYGETTYALHGREATTRSTVPAIVLETIYGLAGIPAPAAGTGDAYPGYPLAASAGAWALVLAVGWPLLVLLGWYRSRRAGHPTSSNL
jgi:hypothetical protein